MTFRTAMIGAALSLAFSGCGLTDTQRVGAGFETNPAQGAVVFGLSHPVGEYKRATLEIARFDAARGELAPSTRQAGFANIYPLHNTLRLVLETVESEPQLAVRSGPGRGHQVIAELDPGTYALRALELEGAPGTEVCFALGALTFDVEAGAAVYLGEFYYALQAPPGDPDAGRIVDLVSLVSAVWDRDEPIRMARIAPKRRLDGAARARYAAEAEIPYPLAQGEARVTPFPLNADDTVLGEICADAR
ncbi:MAG: hypothetical protein ACFB2Z_04260 [Maricaulaceae bacterium]